MIKAQSSSNLPKNAAPATKKAKAAKNMIDPEMIINPSVNPKGRFSFDSVFSPNTVIVFSFLSVGKSTSLVGLNASTISPDISFSVLPAD